MEIISTSKFLSSDWRLRSVNADEWVWVGISLYIDTLWYGQFVFSFTTILLRPFSDIFFYDVCFPYLLRIIRLEAISIKFFFVSRYNIEGKCFDFNKKKEGKCFGTRKWLHFSWKNVVYTLSGKKSGYTCYIHVKEMLLIFILLCRYFLCVLIL